MRGWHRLRDILLLRPSGIVISTAGKTIVFPATVIREIILRSCWKIVIAVVTRGTDHRRIILRLPVIIVSSMIVVAVVTVPVIRKTVLRSRGKIVVPVVTGIIDYGRIVLRLPVVVFSSAIIIAIIFISVIWPCGKIIIPSITLWLIIVVSIPVIVTAIVKNITPSSFIIISVNHHSFPVINMPFFNTVIGKSFYFPSFRTAVKSALTAIVKIVDHYGISKIIIPRFNAIPVKVWSSHILPW